MRSLRGLAERHRSWWLEAAFEGTEAIQGTIQRVDYQRRKLTVIAQGRLLEFV